MADKLDYKKEYKHLYLPPTKPSIIDVPEMTFIVVDGEGDPNTSEAYKEAVELIYGLSYSIKMSKMKSTQPEGYFEYVVPPLEGLWWGDNLDFERMVITDKNKFCWTSMIRQPEFVTEEVFQVAQETLSKKKPDLDVSKARLLTFHEGLCVQILHIGSYDDESTSIKRMDEYALSNGYRIDISDFRKHHEIYLSDPRKTVSTKLKTVIRHPIAKA